MNIYFKLFFYSILLNISLMGVEINNSYEQNSSNSYQYDNKVYGYNLFNGNFKDIKQFHYNPNYILNVGDEISIKVWGAVELELVVKVDMQGNIFLPKVGVVKVLGVKNKELTKTLQNEVSKVYKNDVYIYADIKIYQHISVFVTGEVNKPGLYEGLSSDSILQFIDKAIGIDNSIGSFRYIDIIRDN
ncbi:MAG: polysaccharide biosynthesis/export family protein, partial [Campylobacterota bacterium]|nr:polysaccharide biosynthesis/export family protein [Campylobacterota bacterium]